MRTKNSRKVAYIRRRARMTRLVIALSLATNSTIGGMNANAQCPTPSPVHVGHPCSPCESVSNPAGVGNAFPTESSLVKPNDTAIGGRNEIGTPPEDSFLNDNGDVDAGSNFTDAELSQVANNFGQMPRASSLASNTGSRGGLDAPNMFGDFFGGTFISDSTTGAIVALAGGDRRFKVSENTSPIPTDRIFTNYNHFHNALTDVSGTDQDLDRFTLGFEKTFWSRQASFEMRLPIAAGLDSEQTSGSSDTQGTEVGNLAMALKFLLLSDSTSAISAGMTATVPTGDDYIENFGVAVFDRVENDAVHLAPFIGCLSTHNDWFFQSYIQVDIDLNGNDVFTETGFQGTLQDQNLLFLDASVGKWLSRHYDNRGNVSGVALIGELHYTSTLNDTDSVLAFENYSNRMDILNATVGLHLQRGLTSLRVGIGAPLRDDEEALFDTEALVQLNRRF